MRRQLDLTPRQLAALDSIERTLAERNRPVMERLRARRDSMFSGRDREPLSREDRLALRSRLDSLTPLRREMIRNDSTARAAAMRVLTDSQRVRVREFQAERRGFTRGRMMQRRGMRPDFGPRGGQFDRGFGRGRRLPGDIGPMGSRLRPDRFGPRPRLDAPRYRPIRPPRPWREW
jgi:hypothetical protein